jgi:hypothetical protein
VSWESITAWASLGTMLVIGTSAVAALIQLQHMRTGNQLVALLSLDEDFQTPELQKALKYLQLEFPSRILDAAYRRDLEQIGFVDSTVHPELVVCNWFNKIGTLVKHRLVSEQAFMDLFARLIVHSWHHANPAIAIMRRSRGPFQYHDFEYLARHAEKWLQRNPGGIFPGSTERITLQDPWLADDHP